MPEARDVALNALMYLDATYRHGLLVLEDKISVAHTLGARVPPFDNALGDSVCDPPWLLLLDGHVGKVFRESVRPLAPDEICRKSKIGFVPPDASWFRGDLRSFVATTLAPDRIVHRGVQQPGFVVHALEEHFAGRVNHIAPIWSALSFQARCEEFGVFGSAACARSRSARRRQPRNRAPCRGHGDAASELAQCEAS